MIDGKSLSVASSLPARNNRREENITLQNRCWVKNEPRSETASTLTLTIVTPHVGMTIYQDSCHSTSCGNDYSAVCAMGQGSEIRIQRGGQNVMRLSRAQSQLVPSSPHVDRAMAGKSYSMIRCFCDLRNA